MLVLPLKGKIIEAQTRWKKKNYFVLPKSEEEKLCWKMITGITCNSISMNKVIGNQQFKLTSDTLQSTLASKCKVLSWMYKM